MKTKTATAAAPINDTAPSGNKQAKAALDRMIRPALHKVSDLKTRKEKLHYVADMIEAEALVAKSIGFNMEVYRDDGDPLRNNGMPYHDNMMQTQNTCGTVACIAGWTVLLEHGADFGKPSGGRDVDFHGYATALLGLTSREADCLFCGNDFPYDENDEDHGVDLDDITPAQAVAVIRDFADSGDIRWSSFDTEGKLRKAP